MSDKIKQRAVIALGYFDSVHIGHQKVIEKAKETAQKLNAITVVFTFRGNLRATLSGGHDSVVYTASERENIIKGLGVEQVFFAPTSRKFLSLGKLAFLNYLNKIFNVVCYVSGEDYKFGKMGKGNVDYIKKYAYLHGQKSITVDTLNFESGKISTTAIKGLLKDGNVEKANALLGRSYSVSGVVFSDRKVGRSLGFPTINLNAEQEKQRLKFGVYAGSVALNGVKHKALINYGARPTFDLDKPLIEAHILDFSGELYGQTVTVEFEKFVREVIKFESAEQLKAQITKDIERVKNYD